MPEQKISDATAKPCIGVLAIQGDYASHAAALEEVGAEPVLVRKPDQPRSPFMSFPGNRYRTGRGKIKGKTVASWILAFQLQQPEENPGSREER